MYLDQRGYLIIKEIASNPSVTGKELEDSLKLTRKQISYSLGKINAYLKGNGFDEVRWLKTGRFLVSMPVIREFAAAEESIPGNTYVCSDEERVYWIFLRLLCHKEELSTYHFTDELKISKNTLMGDLKRLSLIVAQYGLKLNYERRTGYQLQGKEYDKRGILTEVLRRILDMPGGEEQLRRIYGIEEDELRQRREDIRKIEEKLQVRYTDDRVKELPYVLSFIFFQIRNQCVLRELPESCRQVVGTREYAVMSAYCSKYGIEEEKEKIFFTVQIQISDIHSLEVESQSREMLVLAAERMVRAFERVSCVKIGEKNGLLDALVQHLSPALYRIRYRYHVQPDITDMILPRYQYLHEMVKLASEELETMVQLKIPDRELIYITALIGAWLRKEGTLEEISPRKKAVIVCSNGVTVSNFLYVTLKELFPEIDFLDCLSARGFESYKKSFQLVFTTVRLETGKKQFVIKPGLGEYARSVLRKKVMSEIYGSESIMVTTEGVLELVERYAKIEQREKLEAALNRYLYPSEEDQGSEASSLGELYLRDLLPVKNINFSERTMDWVEAVRTAAAPLWKNGSIETKYVDKMISLITEEKPYIMLADGVIVAHAGIEDGVRMPGMSLLRLPERISVNGYMDADLIMVLATPDKTVHLTALYQLLHFLGEPENLKVLREAQRKTDLQELLDVESALKI